MYIMQNCLQIGGPCQKLHGTTQQIKTFISLKLFKVDCEIFISHLFNHVNHSLMIEDIDKLRHNLPINEPSIHI